MKRKLKKLGLMLALMLHSFVVVCIPVTSWVVAIAIEKTWMYIIAAVLYFFVQVPIAVYAITKNNSIFDKIIERIRNI
jgi:uncharacterized membrane protein